MSMTISILAFGIAKEIVGGAATTLQVDEGTTVELLKKKLVQQYPGLQRLSSFMLAVNGEYADDKAIIAANDEIAIIPPVSGG
jgi:molybdopterin synthase sulfur carrier subunit